VVGRLGRWVGYRATGIALGALGGVRSKVSILGVVGLVQWC
jgi:hypothetical protein